MDRREASLGRKLSEVKYMKHINLTIDDIWYERKEALPRKVYTWRKIVQLGVEFAELEAKRAATTEPVGEDLADGIRQT